MLQNEEFKKNLVIPYFKDIFKDLISQGEDDDKSAKCINKLTFVNYSNLPGIIGERLFSVMNLG